MQYFLEQYVLWVTSNQLLSAFLHFAILGTLGEFLSIIIREKSFKIPYSPLQLISVVLAWAFLGIFIKYGFIGMKGFVAALISNNLLPEICSHGNVKAFTISLVTNLFFGPQMMLVHRVEENIIMRKWNFTGITKAWKTLIWFWIPAHTLTFALPPEYQIGLAACWSIVLGFIMGITAPKKT